MAYAFVQFVESDNSGTGITSISTPAFGSSLTAGNLLLVIVQYAGDETTVSLSGGGQTGWSSETQFGGGSGNIACFYKENIAGGSTTAITATFGAGKDYPTIYSAEISGLATGSARLAFAAQLAIGVSAGTDTATSGLLGTLSGQPAMLFGAVFTGNGPTVPAAGSGFTLESTIWDYGGADHYGRIEHKRLTSTSSVAATWSPGATTDCWCLGWAFLEASTGGPSSTIAAYYNMLRNS